MSGKIDSTLTLVKGHLAEAAVKHGAEMIGKWEADLEKAEWRGAKMIHADLTKLRHHLEGDTQDGIAIGELLIHLGESTERAAAHAESGGGKIESLGKALVSAGKGLGADVK